MSYTSIEVTKTRFVVKQAARGQFLLVKHDEQLARVIVVQISAPLKKVTGSILIQYEGKKGFVPANMLDVEIIGRTN